MKRVGGPSGPAGMRMMYPAPSFAEPEPSMLLMNHTSCSASYFTPSGP